MKTSYLLTAFCIGIFLLFVSGASQPQQSNSASQEPKTKLESFQRQTGSVVIKGFSTIGSIGSGMGSVSIDCMEFTDAATGKRQMGIVIDVVKSGRPDERPESSFIDYEEIEALLKGIDYIANVEPNATKLDNFEAIYKTKGDFRVATYSHSGKIEAAVSSGYLVPTSAFITLQDLSVLRKLISKAKATLDSIK